MRFLKLTIVFITFAAFGGKYARADCFSLLSPVKSYAQSKFEDTRRQVEKLEWNLIGKYLSKSAAQHAPDFTALLRKDLEEIDSEMIPYMTEFHFPKEIEITHQSYGAVNAPVPYYDTEKHLYYVININHQSDLNVADPALQKKYWTALYLHELSHQIFNSTLEHQDRRWRDFMESTRLKSLLTLDPIGTEARLDFDRDAAAMTEFHRANVAYQEIFCDLVPAVILNDPNVIRDTLRDAFGSYHPPTEVRTFAPDFSPMMNGMINNMLQSGRVTAHVVLYRAREGIWRSVEKFLRCKPERKQEVLNISFSIMSENFFRFFPKMKSRSEHPSPLIAEIISPEMNAEDWERISESLVHDFKVRFESECR